MRRRCQCDVNAEAMSMRRRFGAPSWRTVGVLQQKSRQSQRSVARAARPFRVLKSSVGNAAKRDEPRCLFSQPRTASTTRHHRSRVRVAQGPRRFPFDGVVIYSSLAICRRVRVRRVDYRLALDCRHCTPRAWRRTLFVDYDARTIDTTGFVSPSSWRLGLSAGSSHASPRARTPSRCPPSACAAPETSRAFRRRKPPAASAVPPRR